jgi:hypothetical protein
MPNAMMHRSAALRLKECGQLMRGLFQQLPNIVIKLFLSLWLDIPAPASTAAFIAMARCFNQNIITPGNVSRPVSAILKLRVISDFAFAIGGNEEPHISTLHNFRRQCHCHKMSVREPILFSISFFGWR